VLPPAANLPADLPVIGPENAAALTEVARFGQGRLDSIAWSADGATFAVSGYTGIYLYDAATLQEVRAFDPRWVGDTNLSLQDVSLSPQGDVLALLLCITGGCFVELWQTSSGQLIRTLSDEDQLPSFTPDGQTILFVQSVDSETSLVWQDVHTGETQHTVQLEFLQTSSPTLSPGGEMLAEVTSGTTVRLWDTASGQVQHTIEAPAIVNRVAFSPQGDLLAVNSSVSMEDNVVSLWDVKSGQSLHVLEGYTGSVGNIVFSPDGRMLAIGSAEDRTVRLWDTASGQLLHLLTNNNGESMAFSPDGRQLAVVSGGSMDWGGSKVLFYDIETEQLLRTLAGYNITMGVAFTPDGHSLIAAGGYEAQTWDVHSGQLRQTQASDIPIWSMALSPDGSLMAWGGGEHRYNYMADDHLYLVQMWDMATGQLLYTLQEQAGVVFKVLFSPDGRLLATWSDVYGLVHLRQASTGELLFSQPASNVFFHPNGRLFAIGESLQLWDVDTFTLVRSFEGLFNPVTFSADGHIVASSDTGISGLWHSDTGDLLLPFTGGDMGTLPGGLSPDGRILASKKFQSGALELRDMTSGQILWASASGYVTSVAFSPDGRLLATGNHDGTVSLWGVNPSLPASGACVNDSAFVLDVNVPDGTHVAPGASFTKTWRLRNSGTCAWDPAYRLNFVSGEQMNGPESMALGETVLPGEEVDISVDLLAPQADGTYQGQWQLIAPDGTPFGVKPYVEIVVP
jgi:WD40 repeat protein